MEQDVWSFNDGDVGAIYVRTIGGREVFEGNLGDAEVGVIGGGVDAAEATTPDEDEEDR